VWKNTFIDYDDQLLKHILFSEWRQVACDEDYQIDEKINKLITETLSTTNPELSTDRARNIIANTPPISQIKQLFSNHTMEKEITAYQALHVRFDSLTRLAESIIDKFGKQGEFIVYDLMVEGRLSAGRGERGSVEEFIEYFTAPPDTPDLFTAGLEIELISKSKREALIHVRECEWARYFHDYHPQVGYLMACSSDEVGFKAFNQSLRLQRTQTIMEGAEICDFRIFSVDQD
jgi:hypothetical protein